VQTDHAPNRAASPGLCMANCQILPGARASCAILRNGWISGQGHELRWRDLRNCRLPGDILDVLHGMIGYCFDSDEDEMAFGSIAALLSQARVEEFHNDVICFAGFRQSHIGHEVMPQPIPKIQFCDRRPAFYELHVTVYRAAHRDVSGGR